MAPLTVTGIEEVQGLIGKTIGPSDWREVTPGDDRHASPSCPATTSGSTWTSSGRRTESPFGTTIAHGNLTLATIDGFRDSLLVSGGFKLGVNYGWNKVRFPAPVPAGSRIRASIETVSVDEVGDGWWQIVQRWTVEVEGSEKPCCVADAVGRALV